MLRPVLLVAVAAVVTALLAVPVSGSPGPVAHESSSVLTTVARAPGTVIKTPATVTTGGQIMIRGRIPTTHGTRRSAVVASRTAGARRWTSGDTGQANRRGKFVLSITAPMQAGPLSVRLTSPRLRRLKAVKHVLTLSVVAPDTTPMPIPMPTPAATPTASPTATPTSVPTATATSTPTPTTTPTVVPTYEPTPGSPLGDPNDWTYIGSGDSMRWDACRTIAWSYDAASQPYAGAEADMTTAVAMLAEKTGHAFTRVPVGDAAFTVNWSTPEQEPRLAGSVIGIGGPTTRRIDPALNQGTQRAIVGGLVVLDASHASFPGGFGQVGWGQVMLHEVSHALGLGHAAGREQVMAPMSSTYNTVFGAGDLTGLAEVGTSRGCLVMDRYGRAAKPDTTIIWTD